MPRLLSSTKGLAMRFGILFLLPVALSGCINIANQLQPVNADVKEVLKGEDCTPIVLGMAFGTNTVEEAMQDGRIVKDPGDFRQRIKLNDRTPITRIRTIQ